jgi:hypothetical protein
MAKKKTLRERPTLKTLRELRATIDDLQRQLSRSTALLTEIQTVDTKVLSKAVSQAGSLADARGLLHSILDELGDAYGSVISNKARRVLGRPEVQIKSSIQQLLEQHAKATAALSLAN